MPSLSKDAVTRATLCFDTADLKDAKALLDDPT